MFNILESNQNIEHSNSHIPRGKRDSNFQGYGILWFSILYTWKQISCIPKTPKEASQNNPWIPPPPPPRGVPTCTQKGMFVQLGATSIGSLATRFDYWKKKINATTHVNSNNCVSFELILVLWHYALYHFPTGFCPPNPHRSNSKLYLECVFYKMPPERHCPNPLLNFWIFYS